MRIFFASTIGFQVPIKEFGSGKIILQGLLFTLALVGKLVVGFMVPNFTQVKNFTGNHLRDCLIVGCSMVSICILDDDGAVYQLLIEISYIYNTLCSVIVHSI